MPGLDFEYTLAKPGSHKKLPLEERQCVVVLQLCVANGVLVFQIVHADVLPEALREFLGDNLIKFCGAAAGNNVKMLKCYNITTILEAQNLQRMIPNPTNKYPHFSVRLVQPLHCNRGCEEG
jgi:hypothetical protein